MATRKFLTSVADVYGYDSNDNILFTSKTLLDSSIEVSLGSAPVRGGKGNQLQYIYYHTGEMKFTLTDTQWNLALLGSTVGDTISGGGSYYGEETVNMSGSQASITGSALAFAGSNIYGWATSPTGVTQRVTFSGQTFTVTGSAAGNWCIRYYKSNLTAGNQITVSANMIPKVVKLVMETQLNSADVSTNKIGIVQIIVPSCQLSGAFTISMKADGVSNTPLTGMALAYTSTGQDLGCAAGESYYAKIVEIIDNTLWYTGVVALSVDGGNFTMSKTSTHQMDVWAISSWGTFLADPAQLDFTSSASTTIATVGLHTGLVTSLSTSGSSLLTAKITAAPTITATATVTVS